MHELHTLHAVPDLRIAGGRFGGQSFEMISRPWDLLYRDHRDRASTRCETLAITKRTSAERPFEPSVEESQVCASDQSTRFHRKLH